MKEYVKPSFEYIELRPEERLACCPVEGKRTNGQVWYSWGWGGRKKHICRYCGRSS